MMSSTAKTECPAGVIDRGIAYLVDCCFAFVIFLLTQILVFAPVRVALDVTDDWFRSGLNTELYTLFTISIPVWLYFSILESSSWTATMGKRIVGVRVVDCDSHSRIRFPRSMLRTIVKLLPWELAHLANNFPQPIWYTDEPGFRIGFVFSGSLLVVYVVVMRFSPRRRCVHDRLARTIVVKCESNRGNSDK